jgi:predicted P-loop ATPase
MEVPSWQPGNPQFHARERARRAFAMRNINDEDYIRKAFQPRIGNNIEYTLEYVIGSQKNIIYNLANAIHAIEHDDVLMDLFHFNLSTNREMLKTYKKLIPVNDRIVHECMEYMQRNCLLRAIKKTDVADAISVVSRRTSYDPLMDWLNSLVWDGAPRIDTWLNVCFGVEDNEYHRMVGSKMLIAMVKRAKEPGCKSDYMVVLEGEQGPGKTEAIKVLGGQFYSENLPPLDANGGKEACIHVLGYWIIEVAEMHAMMTTRVDAAHLKSFISRTHERFRPVHGRREEETPRRCFFIGTTNKTEYLRDETGNRRVWPIYCLKVELEWLRDNRNQLFAEALQRCRDGELSYPSREFERAHVVAEQAKRQEFDELHNLMTDFLGSQLTPETTATKVWRAITNKPDAIPNVVEAKRMATIFTGLGWYRTKSNGRMIWRKR